MVRLRSMPIGWSVMVGWLVFFSALVGGIGAYPSYRLLGRAGLRAEWIAWLIVLFVHSVSGAAVVHWAHRGAGSAAAVFVGCGMLRALGCLILAAVAEALCTLPVVAFLLWIGIFYGALLVGEVIWLVRALRHDAFLLALGHPHRIV